MPTQLSLAKEGVISFEMETVAKEQGVSPEQIRKKVAKGQIVIPKNNNRSFSPEGIGGGFRTKVNANIV